MIPSVLSSGEKQTIGIENRPMIAQGQDVESKGQQSQGNVKEFGKITRLFFNLDHDGEYEILYICQNAESCIARRVNVAICKVLNKNKFKKTFTYKVN